MPLIGFSTTLGRARVSTRTCVLTARQLVRIIFTTHKIREIRRLARAPASFLLDEEIPPSIFFDAFPLFSLHIFEHVSSRGVSFDARRTLFGKESPVLCRACENTAGRECIVLLYPPRRQRPIVYIPLERHLNVRALHLLYCPTALIRFRLVLP